MKDSILLLLVFCLAFPLATPATAKETAPKMLVVKISRDTSLEQLLQSKRLDLKDKDVIPFLTELLKLNESIRSISLIKQGTVIRLPLAFLKASGGITDRAGTRKMPEADSAQVKPGDTVPSRKSLSVQRESKETLQLQRDTLLNVLKTTFSVLGDDVTVEQDGFRHLTVDDHREIVFDTASYPLIRFPAERVLLIDKGNKLPRGTRDLIEIGWPEYRIISYQGDLDLSTVVPLVIEEAGYEVSAGGKIITTGDVHLEYRADMIVTPRSGLYEATPVFISFLKEHDLQTPRSLLDWLGKRDLHVLEMPLKESVPSIPLDTTTERIPRSDSQKEFSEKILEIIGYPFFHDIILTLQVRKDFSYRIKADIGVDLGYRKKLIVFGVLSEQERGLLAGIGGDYFNKQGFDIISIHPVASRDAILEQIASLFAQHYEIGADMRASTVWERGRYRLEVSGIVIRSPKGVFLFTRNERVKEEMEFISPESLKIIAY